MSWHKALFWRLLDPMLLRMAARSAHLQAMHPEIYNSQKWQNAAVFSDKVKFSAGAVISNWGERENLKIGDYSHIAGELSVIAPNGTLSTGRYCFVGPGSRIWAQTSVQLGNYVLISHLVDIHDTNAHSTNMRLRRADPVNLFELDKPIDWAPIDSRPVFIEDDVWIGFKGSIMKGVRIGSGSVVAAGSIVTKDVPPNTLVAGAPARVIRELND